MNIPTSLVFLRRVWRELQRIGSLLAIELSSAVGQSPPLPPGSIGLSSLARFGDEWFYLRKFKQFGPLFKVYWAQNLTICVVGLQRARHLFAAHARALMPLTINIESFVPKGFLRCMAPSDHPHYRAQFLSAMTTDLLRSCEPEFRNIIAAELDALASDRAASTDRLIDAFDHITTDALLFMFFGFPRGHRKFMALEEGYRRLGPKGFVFPIGPEQIEAFSLLRDTAIEILDEYGTDADSAADCVMRRIVADNRADADATTIGNAIYMIELGRYDTRSLLRWILKYLSDNRDVLTELRAADTGGKDLQPLAEACVLETLRLDQAEALNRIVNQEFVFGGYRFPKGCAVRVMLRESHNDAATFSDPEAFTPCRFVDQSYSADHYAPFGLGEHRCLAAPFVVRLCTLFVLELVLRCEWSVTSDGPRHRGRHHWEPSPSFAIDLRRRQSPHDHA